MMRPFTITRADGRTNYEVLRDLIKDAPPGHVYTYEDLVTALSAGSDTAYDRRAVNRIVMASYAQLLREIQRALHSVRRIGYRVALASDHTALATGRKRRADQQLKKAVVTLQGVRWHELDENTRRIHEGHLSLTMALYEHQRALDARLRRVEAVIASSLNPRAN
jgi:hypothetical protein